MREMSPFWYKFSWLFKLKLRLRGLDVQACFHPTYSHGIAKDTCLCDHTQKSVNKLFFSFGGIEEEDLMKQHSKTYTLTFQVCFFFLTKT